MGDTAVERIPLSRFPLWDTAPDRRPLVSFDLELTARCNNNCRHCYINLPADSRPAAARELSFEEIRAIADEAVSLGALWCTITGGEPLLRDDFTEIYRYLKHKGLLVSVLTNATLITPDRVRLFRTHPPRHLEVSVYGITRETYEAVTRQPGSHASFFRGVNLLLDAGIGVTLKTMVLRSNVHEFARIATFCRKRSRDPFRFDPFLHLRYDGDAARNTEIRAERLSPADIAAVEHAEPCRMQALERYCREAAATNAGPGYSRHLLQCGAGITRCHVSHDGQFRLCAALCDPRCVYDLRQGSLADAWHRFVPRVREMKARQETPSECGACPHFDLCMWCPAHAYLETQSLEAEVPYFCKSTHERIANLAATDA